MNWNLNAPHFLWWEIYKSLISTMAIHIFLWLHRQCMLVLFIIIKTTFPINPASWVFLCTIRSKPPQTKVLETHVRRWHCRKKRMDSSLYLWKSAEPGRTWSPGCRLSSITDPLTSGEWEAPGNCLRFPQHLLWLVLRIILQHSAEKERENGMRRHDNVDCSWQRHWAWL